MWLRAVGLTLLEGRPLFPVVLVTAVGIAAVVLAADLFARDAGGWILGEADGWQGSEGPQVVARACLGAPRRGVAPRRHRARDQAVERSTGEDDLAELSSGVQALERGREVLEREDGVDWDLDRPLAAAAARRRTSIVHRRTDHPELPPEQRGRWSAAMRPVVDPFTTRRPPRARNGANDRASACRRSRQRCPPATVGRLADLLVERVRRAGAARRAMMGGPLSLGRVAGGDPHLLRAEHTRQQHRGRRRRRRRRRPARRRRAEPGPAQAQGRGGDEPAGSGPFPRVWRASNGRSRPGTITASACPTDAHRRPKRPQNGTSPRSHAGQAPHDVEDRSRPRPRARRRRPRRRSRRRRRPRRRRHVRERRRGRHAPRDPQVEVVQGGGAEGHPDLSGPGSGVVVSPSTYEPGPSGAPSNPGAHLAMVRSSTVTGQPRGPRCRSRGSTS